MVVFRGWRLYGFAATIFVYVAGILLLSIVSVQNSSQRRPRFRSLKDRDLLNLHRREMIAASTHPKLSWCRPLTFMDGSLMNIEHRTAFKPIKPQQIIDAKSIVQPKVDVESVVIGVTPNAYNRPNETFEEALQVEDKQMRYDSYYSRTRRRFGGEREKESEIRSKPLLVEKQKRNEDREKLTALVSFPGSGNTWFRYLLQQATGIFTGSVYKDLGLLKSGFPAENIHNSSVLVIKTHEWGPPAFNMFGKAILLVREPGKAILAEFNRQSGGHVGFASQGRFTRTYWQQFVVNKLWLWEQTNLAWAKDFPAQGRLKIIFYDDLVANVESTLRDTLRFINRTVDENLLACAMERKEGIYKRRKRILRFEIFTKEMQERIAAKTKEVYGKLGRYY